MLGLTLLAGAYVGSSIYSSISSSRYNRKSLSLQNKALQQQTEELRRQHERETEQQRRENEQLINQVSGMTNTSFGGETSPSLSYDKYGDLG